MPSRPRNGPHGYGIVTGPLSTVDAGAGAAARAADEAAARAGAGKRSTSKGLSRRMP
ncbi:hypothetical protein AB0G86_35940 [Streptomyces scabiei]|uniref:hypothetical protein n=1 Tax=Streptomyces scabiei TaxID=1930 RepID=UPI003407C816